jgi:hypothetical protein
MATQENAVKEEKGAVEQSAEDKVVKDPPNQEEAETASKKEASQEPPKKNDAENQIAAVLTEMQNVSESIAAAADGNQQVEGKQENFGPSIAVIMQDETAASAETNNANQEGQVCNNY